MLVQCVVEDNVVKWLVESDKLCLRDLRLAAFSFVARNFNRIRTISPQRLEQLKDCPTLLLEVMMKVQVH